MNTLLDYEKEIVQKENKSNDLYITMWTGKTITNIKREMNIQPAEKVLNKYIQIHEDELQEALEIYDYYLGEEIKNESAIWLPKRDSGESK